ncbi:type VII secretion protein EccB [Kitasatospora sp. NBC_01287]|uniref:type VII secretion protein EccB n=1 Tax=Kitasatospora sp. NBC_01287 TaxID=2903573 RepID=UPI0022584DBF|nr:type VII secretion protein EccB [Kitasatospora sp. NBC_01287]MCX4745835.1 type VII secretion protein EccB [Kitasatospora sp. NBC_01287]
MQSRRDQVQAHLFVMSRLGSGMLRAEPDAPDTPTGRTTRGAVTGLALGVVIALVVALYGLLKPAATTGWATPGALVVVKESGARYLFVGGQLHPVLNETSAKLLAGSQMTVRQVSAASLASVGRGAPVGLVGAPDGVPAVGQLAQGGWLACGVQPPPAPGSTGGTGSTGSTGSTGKPQLVLSIAPAEQGTALTAAQGVLVGAPDGTSYLLWQGRRLRVDRQNSAPQALGYPTAAPFQVPAALLDALPAGPDLTAPDIPGRGSPGPVLAARPTRVGQLFTDPSGGRYVLTRTGLTPLSVLQYDLLRGDPRTQKDAYAGAAGDPAPIGPEDLAAHTAPGPGLPGGLPATPPALLAAGQAQAVCADLRPSDDGNPVTTVTVLDAAALGGGAPDSEPGVTPGCAPADRIAVRPGAAVLARALSAAGGGSSEYLVAENGVKYPLPSADAVKQLGYTGAPTQAVPQALLALLPSGPSLDPVALATGQLVPPATGTNPCSG